MTRLMEIEGVGTSYSHKLEDAGIRSTEQLLESCATPGARKALAAQAGISESLLLKWVNRADLFRIKGIGQEYSDLLEAAGVDTVPELAQRNASNLHVLLTEINGRRRLVRRMPSEDEIKDWIAQAKTLPRMINY